MDCSAALASRGETPARVSTPAKVSTYAYVNPVIALLLGWWFLDEAITPAIIAGSGIVVVAVALVTSAKVAAPSPAAAPAVDPSRARA